MIAALPKPRRFDLILVGGGLANGLIALATSQRQPSRRIALVEAASAVGGNHTWSFHTTDLAPAMKEIVEPLIEHRWAGYRVEFPELERRVGLSYASFRGPSLHRAVTERLSDAGNAIYLGVDATEVGPHRVLLSTGAAIEADLVVDGRGPERVTPERGCRFQKFLGLELELSRPSPIGEPLLMDARVSQSDGLRFIYVLPFDKRHVLIEDTYFSDESTIDEAELEQRILAYAEQRGYSIAAIRRRERGVLPLPLSAPRARAEKGLLTSGVQGGWYHPTTGYSLPLAARLADFVARRPPSEVVGSDLDALFAERTRQQRYACLLNRLLYGGFSKERRFSVMQRFYSLPEETIARFYAMQTTALDRLRIVCGKPPRGFSLTHSLARARLQ